MAKLARALGLATAVFGVAVAIRPETLARESGLTRRGRDVPPGLHAMVAALGIRDAVSGLAMAAAPRGRALRLAIALRVAADLGDAVILGALLPTPEARRRNAAAALTWAAVCALSATGAGRRKPPPPPPPTI
ncbi:DUF4267 domain-containing protein [Allonocardiopsis opalescens]|uniref:DUF4267 domain-containing protein n=1 Tax=Allonocardiopsis opalescens TaxID=1144618 RepID=A0A2T0PUA6_9ACTN|nr:DUF4267 domain-containing protein [Allonocardiopsis opalescens]PRX92485.1 hypothetical protein CLV72_110247 [Allonocardiopsis opalescens]